MFYSICVTVFKSRCSVDQRVCFAGSGEKGVAIQKGFWEIVWFQKISIPPPPLPRKVAGISEGEGGGGQREKFPREGGAHVELLSRGCKT